MVLICSLLDALVAARHAVTAARWVAATSVATSTADLTTRKIYYGRAVRTSAGHEAGRIRRIQWIACYVPIQVHPIHEPERIPTNPPSQVAVQHAVTDVVEAVGALEGVIELVAGVGLAVADSRSAKEDAE
jgi:hypothetical protein